MELGVRVALEPSESPPGQAVIPGRLLLDVVRSLPTDQLSLEYRSAQQDVEVVAGPSKFHLRTLPPEDFPKLPEAPGEGGDDRSRGRLRRHDRPRRAGRVAGRDAPAPHRRARHRHRQRAAHGRDRLVPAGREGDAARRAAGGVARGERAGPDAAGAGSDRRRRRRDASAWPRSRTRSCSPSTTWCCRRAWSRVASRTTSSCCPESYEHELRVSRDELLEVVRRVGLLAQKNAPLRLRFSEGTLDVSAQTPDVGEASESLPDSVRGRTVGDRLQPGVLPRGPGERRVGGADPEADQPAAPGADPVGRRGLRLHLPRHADPAERLGGRRRAIVTRLELRDFRNYEAAELELPAGLAVVVGPNGAGKTNLLEAVYFGCTGRLAAHVQRARAGPARRRRSPGWLSTPATTRRSPPAGGRLRAGRGEAPARRRRAPSTSLVDSRRPPAGERLHARAARAREGRARRPPRPPRPGRRRAVAGPRRGARRLLARAGPAQRPARPHPRRAPRAPSALDAWDAELAREGIALMEHRAEAVEGLQEPFARLAGQLGLPGPAEVRYRPRSAATDAAGPRRRAGRAPRRRPRARLHRARAAPRRAGAAARRGRAARLRLAGPAAHGAARAPVRRARAAQRPPRPPAADAARRRHVRARLRAPRAARRAAALGRPGDRDGHRGRPRARRGGGRADPRRAPARCSARWRREAPGPAPARRRRSPALVGDGAARRPARGRSVGLAARSPDRPWRPPRRPPRSAPGRSRWRANRRSGRTSWSCSHRT